jgi:rod shape-determining protein MreD
VEIRRIAWYCGSALIILLLQIMVVKFLALDGITPDILLVWLAYLTLSEGQIVGTIAGFSLGVLFDLATGGFLGLTALSKTLACFFGGYFYNENKTLATLGSYQFIMLVFVLSFLNNFIYFAIFVAGTQMHYPATVLWYGLTTAIYTAVVSLLPMFLFSRKAKLEQAGSLR